MRKPPLRVFTVLGTLAAAVSCTSAWANNGDAGCGVGGALFEKNTILSQTLASFTNVVLWPTWLGAMTSNTSGCRAHGLVRVDREQIYYAEANFERLSQDMARGEGESLTAFAQVMGCNDSALAEFGKMTRARYETLFPSARTTPVEMVKSVKREIQQNPALAKQCLDVG